VVTLPVAHCNHCGSPCIVLTLRSIVVDTAKSEVSHIGTNAERCRNQQCLVAGSHSGDPPYIPRPCVNFTPSSSCRTDEKKVQPQTIS
jgi:hypothetical protein